MSQPVRIYDSEGRPLAVTAVGDGTYKLQVDTELTATIDPTGLATHAGQDELKALIGEVQASPTSNTVLDRLKSAVTHLATIAGFVSGGHGQVDVLESALPTGAATSANQTDIIKTEDAVHSSGDKGVMALGVRKDTVANLAGADGDYAPMPVGANGLYVDAHLGEVLSYLLDSIDVAKMSKGAVTTAHNAITGTATSTEVDCRGFNSLGVHFVSSATDKTWTISVQGATGSGLTFVPLLDKTTGLAASEITTDISGFFAINNIPDYIKIVATEVDDGATVTIKVWPFNS